MRDPAYSDDPHITQQTNGDRTPPAPGQLRMSFTFLDGAENIEQTMAEQLPEIIRSMLERIQPETREERESIIRQIHSEAARAVRERTTGRTTVW